MLVPESTLALAQIADAPVIAQLSRTLIETGLPWSWVPWRVGASLRQPETNVLVARAGERIAGFGIMRYGMEAAHLDLFAVDRAWQGQGLGRRLLEWLERPARVAGLARIVLEVRAENAGARVFYERLGYRTLALLPGYYQGREAALRLGRSLGQTPGKADAARLERGVRAAARGLGQIVGIAAGKPSVVIGTDPS